MTIFWRKWWRASECFSSRVYTNKQSQLSSRFISSYIKIISVILRSNKIYIKLYEVQRRINDSFNNVTKLIKLVKQPHFSFIKGKYFWQLKNIVVKIDRKHNRSFIPLLIWPFSIFLKSIASISMVFWLTYLLKIQLWLIRFLQKINFWNKWVIKMI